MYGKNVKLIFGLMTIVLVEWTGRKINQLMVNVMPC